jgi:uncharacterized protein YkwD
MKKGDVTVAFLLTLFSTGCMAGFAPPPPQAPPVTSEGDEIRALITLVNAHRVKVGCKPLQWDNQVGAVAQNHSDDMVARGYFNHKTPEGVTPFQRLEKAGVRAIRAAENIAAGQTTAQVVMTSWLGSPGHRRNIEDCAMQQHGIGFTRGTKVLPYGTIINAWTHNFVVLRP